MDPGVIKQIIEDEREADHCKDSCFWLDLAAQGKPIVVLSGHEHVAESIFEYMNYRCCIRGFSIDDGFHLERIEKYNRSYDVYERKYVNHIDKNLENLLESVRNNPNEFTMSTRREDIDEYNNLEEVIVTIRTKRLVSEFQIITPTEECLSTLALSR